VEVIIYPPTDDWGVSYRDQVNGLRRLDLPRGEPQPETPGCPPQDQP
jgi:hypothetical protein